jgi:pilus assembly protein Flp/PilA
MKQLLVDFAKDEAGLTMIEYAIAGALVTVAAVGAFSDLGTAIVTRVTALVAAVNT